MPSLFFLLMTVIYSDIVYTPNEQNIDIVLVPLNNKTSTLGYMKKYKKIYPKKYLKYKDLCRNKTLLLGDSVFIDNTFFMAIKRKQTDKTLYQHLLKGLEKVYEICNETNIKEVHICISDLLHDISLEQIKKYLEKIYSDDIFLKVYVYTA